VAQLASRGVRMPHPAQVFVDDDVDVGRIAEGAVLYPGTRLHGARTYVGPGASVGAEGPVVLHDAVLGEAAAVASGYVRGAVLLTKAKLGANAHVREGTLLEEEASTAHAVGLKQTILLSFVTLGSLINFCDVLMSGGTSRKDHSEVGSGFIHFNFTPWGAKGDKATPSLIGDVVRGVLLDQRRIFLGGSGGVVGPRRVGYGSIVAAGQVLRRDVDEGRLALDVAAAVDTPVRAPSGGRIERIWRHNAEFIGQLVALREWYRQVRRARIADGPDHDAVRVPTEEAIAVIDTCIEERWSRLAAFLGESGRAADVEPHLEVDVPRPAVALDGPAEHVAWVKELAAADRDRLRDWLGRIAAEAAGRIAPA
jgi:hypothetical protein